MVTNLNQFFFHDLDVEFWFIYVILKLISVDLFLSYFIYNLYNVIEYTELISDMRNLRFIVDNLWYNSAFNCR